ncbi:MAG: PAS domain-containing protein [Nitrospinae bacterium]|nr:PAS domain-containing protein [Nitrospinota bacterium]
MSSNPSKKGFIHQDYSIIVIGILLSLFYWLSESFMHIFIFHRSVGFTEGFLPHDPNELWMRTLMTVTIIGFTFYTKAFIARRRQVEALEQEHRLFMQGPVIVFKWAPEEQWPVRYVSPNVMQELGYQASDLMSGKILYASIIYSEDLERIASEVKTYSESGADAFRQNYRVIKADGEIRWVDDYTVVERNDRGGITHYYGYILDITDIKKEHESLIKSENSLAEAQQIAHIGNWDWDIVNNNLRWSDEIYRIFGLTPQDFGATYEAFLSSVHPEDRELVKNAVNKALYNKKTYSIDHRIVLPDGAKRIVHEQARVIYDRDDKPVRMIGTVQDITQQRHLEEQLRHAQKMEAVGQLAGGIAHDFNNILTGILGYGHILITKKGEDELVKNCVSQIIGQSQKAAELTKDLLTFSRKQVMNLRHTDLNVLIKMTEKILARLIGEHIEIRTNLTDKDLIVTIDPAHIEHSLMNLATNARDAMPDRGTLTISTGLVDIDNEFINAYGYGEIGMYALISFADTGIGMDDVTQKRIFEPFFTTKEAGKGTGLGLAMVYGIVKQHNGFINVYSEPGRGTVFKIYLPITELAVEKNETHILIAQKGGAEIVLLAEDDATMRKAIKILLEEFGYRVIEAVNGEDAVNKFIENKDRIQFAIFDTVMPKKSGMEAYKEIKKMKPDTKALFMSGYTADKTKDILEQGLPLLSKPIAPDELLRKMREIIGGGD